MSHAILFTDWDGTVTLQDSNDLITDNLGMGRAERLKLNTDIFNGTKSFRVAFKEMLDSIDKPFSYCVDYLIQNVKLDPGFKETVKFCKANNIPVVVVSSGMDKIIHSLLDYLFKDDIELKSIITIYANKVKINPEDDSWEIDYLDDSSFGHDKNDSIMTYAGNFRALKKTNKVDLYYCGDGVSDISASRSCDHLFAKANRDLVEICKRDGIKFTEFHSFFDILENLQKNM